MEITGYRLQKLAAPIGRAIGDSQVGPITDFELLYLEVTTNTGDVGVGLDRVNLTGDYAVAPEAIAAEFDSVGDELLGASPFTLRNRMTRPRGGRIGRGRFEALVDVALWDLCGKRLGQSVASLMGAETDTVETYVSGLSFHNDDDATRAIYREFADLGFTSAKVKVGYETVEKDIARLRLVRDVLGDEGTLMIDANEAFSPKEACRRLDAYREAGFDVYWFEDPVLRHDIDGIRRVADAAPRTHVNVGEYVGLEHTRRLLERGAADIVNLRGLSAGRATAQLAYSYGRPLAVGNTPGDVGVHLAAALPEVTFLEWSKPGWAKLFDDPISFADGRAHVPERPGHGLSVSDSAIDRFGTTVVER
jgi:L-alanine-DL-glutamate epimerase-like enolase superfamily enzyme